MRKYSSLLQSATLASVLAAATLAASASAGNANDLDLLLSINFEPRQVVKVESGDFRFKPGQLAPIHTHPAPAIGYVTKGAIIVQAEGREPYLLNTGDVFYEPAGPRILRFDNASPHEEASFIDFNLQQEGEPFIVFEKPPSEDIDRRALPETTYDGVKIDGVDIYSHTLQPDGKQYLDLNQPMAGFVAEGAVELRGDGRGNRRIKAGEVFYRYKAGAGAVLVNTSSDVPAKVIVFNLHKS